MWKQPAGSGFSYDPIYSGTKSARNCIVSAVMSLAYHFGTKKRTK